MDFMSLLDTANKNNKINSQKLNEVKTDLDHERRAELKRIEAEKREKMEMLKRKKATIPPKPVQEEKKFTIPKKSKEKSEEDKAKILAYMEKKAEEERQLLKKKQAEKEKLIQLRLQAHGGKATKRIAKNFGMSALDLQIKYGHDHEHVERLQKQQWREEEECEQLADKYRNGVYKAIAQKRKIDEKMRASGSASNREPHRIATSKANSLMGLSSRHQANRDSFSPPRESSKPKPQPVPEVKKPRPAPVVDFNTLMKAAQDIAEGKKTSIDLERTAAKRPANDQSSSSRSLSSSSTAKPKSDRDREEYARLMEKNRSSTGPAKSSSSLKPSSSSISKPIPSSNSKPNPSLSSKRPEGRPQSSAVPHSAPATSSKPSAKLPVEKEEEKKKDNKDTRGRFKKGPTPPPMIPPAVPGRRYLPGDIRYKQAMEMAKQAGAPPPTSSADRPTSSKVSSTSSKISSSSHFSSKDLDKRKSMSVEKDRDRNKVARPLEKDRERERERDRYRDRDRGRPEYNHRDYRDRDRERDREMERRRERERERIRRERERDRYRHQSYSRAYDYDEYEEEEDDDYDSDLDDFIDDSGMDMDELSRQEFEETLKMVNPKYNKRKWREREQTISLRDMQADYRTIAKEEARSARIGLIEDLHEATKGHSEAL